MKSGSKSVVEIRTTDSRGYTYIEPFLTPMAKEKLPEDVFFKVVCGKRWTDIIVYNQSAGINFYSQKIIDILKDFIDTTNICYPIKIEGIENLSYYTLYNLEVFPFINQSACLFSEEPPCFELLGKNPTLCTLSDSNLKVCSLELKQALEKSKLSNIFFNKIYALSLEEYLDLEQQYK